MVPDAPAVPAPAAPPEPVGDPDAPALPVPPALAPPAPVVVAAEVPEEPATPPEPDPVVTLLVAPVLPVADELVLDVADPVEVLLPAVTEPEAPPAPLSGVKRSECSLLLQPSMSDA
jgi:hypothetical protein